MNYTAWQTDTESFKEALKELIDSAAAAAAAAAVSPSNSSSAATSVPANTCLSNKRPASQAPEAASKRLKTEDPVLPCDQARLSASIPFVHPARAHLIANTGSPEQTELSPLSVLELPSGPWASRTRSTMHDVFHRQFDPDQDNVAYEDLLRRRRSEHLINVDRYVPSTAGTGSSRGKPSPISSVNSISNPFPFDALPKEVKEKIIALLLVKEEPVTVDFTWLRPFISGHSRVPSATKNISLADGAYSIPLGWNDLDTDVGLMQHDCLPFKEALEIRGSKNRKLRGPGRGLTTGLLRVSKNLHKYAAPIFYGQNTFHFPLAASAWMQLDAFLATIGPINVQHLRNIGIHVPLWHRGVQEDYVEGAILDLMSPASRFGVVQPPARDRLLSAVRSCVAALIKAGKLAKITFHLEHGMLTDHWTGRYRNDRQLIRAIDAEEHVIRKQQGIKLLRELSSTFDTAPSLKMHHATTSKIPKYDLSEFRGRLAGVIREAIDYGWKADQTLYGRSW